MKRHFFKSVLISMALVFASVSSVDAARLGGGRSFGRAPSAPIQKQAAPIQKPAQPTQAQPAPTAAQAPVPSRFGGMGGILGGLAAASRAPVQPFGVRLKPLVARLCKGR